METPVRTRDATARTVQSVDRALRLLAIVSASAEPLTGVEVSARGGINRSTAWKLLATLEEHGLIERDAASRYVIGTGIIAIAATAPWTAVAHRSRPVMESLCAATGESVVVSVVTSNGIAGVSQVDGPSSLGVRWVGASLPLTSTSPGKLLLASLPAADLDAILREPIVARTARTITDPDAVRREVADVRARGIATSIGDHELGVNGISAPVRGGDGRLIAALSVTGPDVRLSVERIGQVEPVLRAAAARLAIALVPDPGASITVGRVPDAEEEAS